MTTRKLTMLGALAALSALVAACGSTTTSSSKGPLVVGGVIAITGTSSFEGSNQSEGLLPAIYEINHNGGVMGHQLAYKGVDTRGDPADALPAVQQMLATTSNLVAVAGPGTASAPTIVPVLNSAHIPMMAVAGESAYNRSPYSYFWRLFPPDSANGTAMALWAKQKGYTRVAAVFGSDAGSQGDLPGVLASLQALHVNVVANISLTPDQSSYQSSVNQLIAAHPDVIMTESDAGTAGTFFGELKSLGGLVPIIGTEATYTTPWLTAVQGALGGSDFHNYFSAMIAAPSKVTAAVTAWNNAVKDDHAQLPVSVQSAQNNPFAVTYYDGMIATALAMVAAKSTNPVDFNSYIAKVCNPGSGKTVVYTFAQGVKALNAGKQIQYFGATGLINFDKYHNSYGNQEAVTSSASGNTISLGQITVAAIQAVVVKGVA
ncbi:MAG TPA: ABC transporter substrate-binding protein [Candidatus Dormibacteraeota bacterium]|nr:ABC transporter substrate-binding protein [Candidatus Dormibacteraeota bacterium]